MIVLKEHASCLNAVKKLEAVVEAKGGYIEDKWFLGIFETLLTST